MAVMENEKASRFPAAELKARAAWHYYVEGLTQGFGLSQAVVVPSAADRSNAPLMIGHAAAAYLADNVNAGDVIALGWGRTLKFAINELPRRPIARTTVVSMLGGLTHAQPLNPTESAWEFAEKIGAE